MDKRKYKKEFFREFRRLKYHGHGFFIDAVLTVFDALEEQEKVEFCRSLGVDYYYFSSMGTLIKKY